MSTPRFLDRPFGDNLFINPLYELDEKISNVGFRNATLKVQCEGFRTEFANLLKVLRQPAQIVVAGSFNAGKSSFINTLLGGQEVMPVLAVRCTASVNCLIKGEKRELIVHRPGGNTDRFNYRTDTDLAKQVRTLMKQERNRIERIDITRPDLHFLDKFTLIDTPGLDYNEQDTAASRACIQRADAMIWVLHPEGMRNEDLQIIREFHDANPASPLIVIINRIDTLDAEEITTVVADVKIRLQNITDRVFPLSAYLACQGLQEPNEFKVEQSRFHELSHYLHNHLFTAYCDLQNQRFNQKLSEQAQALARDMENFLRLHSTDEPDTNKPISVSASGQKQEPLVAGRYELTEDGQAVINRSYNRPRKRRFTRFVVSGLMTLVAFWLIGNESEVTLTYTLIALTLFSITTYQLFAWIFVLLRSVWTDFSDRHSMKKSVTDNLIRANEVVDHQTGLIWRRDIERQAAKTVEEGLIFKETKTIPADCFTYEEALARAGEVARQTGLPWRVPTKNELNTLIDKNYRNPASLFPDMPATRFRSSSPEGLFNDCAWYVDFGDGGVAYDDRTNAYAVRLVRGG